MRLAALLAVSCCALARVHDVRETGAKGDGVSKDTAAIQAAVDAASKEGGGTVRIPSGSYLSGTIFLKSFVTIEIEAGATVLFSKDEGDFAKYEELPFKPVDDRETTYFRYALFTGEGLQHVTIQGAGVIDGNRPKRGGPKPIALKRCEHVAIRGITIQNAPNYNISFLGCDWVEITGVTILNGYSDGIDPDSSRFVRISNCYVDSSDDAICPKASRALGQPRATENLTVTNCVLRTSRNNFKFGTESAGDLRNVAVSNIVMLKRVRGSAAISGISLESVDGAHIENVVISNISMEDVRAPIFLRLGNRGRGMAEPKPGSLEEVTISGIRARNATMASSVTGLPGAVVRNIVLDNIQVRCAGGGKRLTTAVPEFPAKYPEAMMFGELPAYGLYARHVEGLILHRFRAACVAADERSEFVFDDVKGVDAIGSAGVAPTSGK